MPETDALITVKATGGDQAAREMQKPIAALDAVGKSHKSLGEQFSKRTENLLLREAMRDLIQMTGLGGQASGMLRMLSLAFRGLYAALGPVGLAIAAIVTAISLARGAMALWAKVTGDTLKPHEDLAKALTKIVEGFEKLARLGVKLTPEQRRYADAVKDTNIYERQRQVELTETAKRTALATAKSGTWTQWLRKVAYELTGNTELLKKNYEEQNKNINAVVELAASSQTLVETGKNVNDWLEETGKLTEFARDKMTEYERKIVDANSSSRSFYENEMERIRRWYEDEKNALDKAKAKREAYNKLIKVRAAQEEKAAKDAQEQWVSGWMSATSGAQDAMSAFASSMIFHANTATSAWQNFYQSMVKWIEDLAGRMLVSGLFNWLLGGAGGFMGGARLGMGLPAISPTQGVPARQWGGVIPGPEGAPRLALVHGGETVTNQQGMGGPGGAAASLVFSPIFTGGIGGLDSRSQRTIVRQLRRLVRSVGEKGIA